MWSVLLYFFASIHIGKADTSISMNEEKFKVRSRTIADSLPVLIEKRDYRKTIELTDRWLTDYSQTTSTVQKNYLNWLRNSYYIRSTMFVALGHHDSALTSLKASIIAGFTDYDLVKTDPNLDPLRTSNEFRELLNMVRERNDYLYILRNSGPYEPENTSSLPEFSYEDIHSPTLVKFRKEYRLDSIAGKGDEILRMHRLMRWVHSIVRHDSSSAIASRLSASELIQYTKRTGKGLDCRGLATILNDAYLSMGYPSRILTCMPKDTNDREHHVITMVYSRKLSKWLWMDPTNESYIMDQTGIFLSVREVRDAVINNDNVILNMDANVNNVVRREKSEYIDRYMAKNLYWFICPLASGYEREIGTSKKPAKYIALLPTGYDPFGTSVIALGDGIGHVTHNADYFWQTPR
jgi:hypothetical protein